MKLGSHYEFIQDNGPGIALENQEKYWHFGVLR
jgi:hypothetical protein